MMNYFREIGLQCLLVLWFLPFENEVLRVSFKKSACFQMAGVHQYLYHILTNSTYYKGLWLLHHIHSDCVKLKITASK